MNKDSWNTGKKSSPVIGNLLGKFWAKHPCAHIIQSAFVSEKMTMFSLVCWPNTASPRPNAFALASTWAYVSQLYSPHTTFLNTLPLACISSSSLRTSRVPRHFLYGYKFTARLKNNFGSVRLEFDTQLKVQCSRPPDKPSWVQLMKWVSLNLAQNMDF